LKFDNTFSGKKHKEAAAAFVSGAADATGLARHRRVFVLEHIITSLAKHLKPVIDATKNFTQKKLTLTYEELQQVPLKLSRFCTLLNVFHVTLPIQPVYLRSGSWRRNP
jgi:hypothetical protein